MPEADGKREVYRVAELWGDRCLVEQTSLLWPEVAAWTYDNLQRLWDAYLGRPDDSSDTFYEKWERQLAEEPDDVHRIAADLVVLYNLFPMNYSSSAKKNQVFHVLSWRFGETAPGLEDVLPALEAGGLGHAGMHYSVARPNQIGFFIRFSQRVISNQLDPHDHVVGAQVAEQVDAEMDQACSSAKNILLHLLYPAHYEPIASPEHKRLLVEGFSEMTGGEQDTDKAIEQIRRNLTDELGRSDFSFYDEDVRPRWDPETPTDQPRAGEKDEGGESTDLPRYWVEKTNVKGRPDRESGRYALGKALWSPQRSQAGVDIYRHLREVQPGDYVLHLTDNYAFSAISRVAEEYREFGGVPDTEWGEQPSYLVPLEDYKELEPPLDRNTLLGEESEFREPLLNLLDSGHKGLFYNRKGDFNQGAYFNPAPSELLDILDEAYESLSGKPLTNRSKSRRNSMTRNRPLADIGTETGMDLAVLERWVGALRRKRQAILYGPPGTGKTYIAEHLAQHLAGQDGFWELVQFHPSYGYEDFIQGIRPKTGGDESLRYELVPGRFLEFCEQAGDTSDPCVLIVDEINRANLSRVFGELMYLLEYRNRAVPLAGGGKLSIPGNVYMIGTMNTADRSIALVDHALRRRFAFLALRPNYDVLRRFHDRENTDTSVEGLISVLRSVNQQINDPNYEVGTTFFMRKNLTEELEDIWRMEIVPYLEEFFFDQPEKVADFRWEKVREAALE